MKQFKLFLILIFLSSLYVKGFSQCDSTYITTFEENSEWVDSLMVRNLADQIKEIKCRILNDTLVYPRNGMAPLGKGHLGHRSIHIPQHYVEGLTYEQLGDPEFKINGYESEGSIMIIIRKLKNEEAFEKIHRKNRFKYRKVNFNILRLMNGEFADVLLVERDMKIKTKELEDLLDLFNTNTILSIYFETDRMLSGARSFGILVTDLTQVKF